MSIQTEFSIAASIFAGSIENFHIRFDCELGTSKERYDILAEEFREYFAEALLNTVKGNEEFSEAELEELADVAFVALGTLHLAGKAGIDALIEVMLKNNGKTWDTHFRSTETGKITRKANP